MYGAEQTHRAACFPESNTVSEQDIDSSATMWLSCLESTTILKKMHDCGLYKKLPINHHSLSDLVNLHCAVCKN